MSNWTGKTEKRRPLFSQLHTLITVHLYPKGPAQCSHCRRSHRALWPAPLCAGEGSSSQCWSDAPRHISRLHQSQCCSLALQTGSPPLSQSRPAAPQQCHSSSPSAAAPHSAASDSGWHTRFCSPFSHKLKCSISPKATNGCFHSAHNPLSSLSQAIGCVQFKVTEYINSGYIKIRYWALVFKESQRTLRWIN